MAFGFSPIGQQSSVGGSAQTNNSGTVPSLLQKHLQSPEFRSILNTLGIDPTKVNVTKQQGLPKNLSLSELKFIPIDQKTTEVLKTLGLNNVELAIVFSAEQEIKLMRKRLKEIKNSTIDKQSMKTILQTLSLPEDIDAYMFIDKIGGLLIIQLGLKEIHENIEKGAEND